ncbi:hypothetical protein QCD60_17325 [Pokkaliibacter sp. MBI-7]|uniref:hypothetical protein n=1 Tax=Pokkaliibacter sp. MBI-7 TaxID=3040600 RepID=UPI002449F05A|nr:hypothetical protein [Pokkaliibacter sp. MBI-7]MDH2434322.1 hypothetical protein [Pokkaliibacter sp. MBI-7]
MSLSMQAVIYTAAVAGADSGPNFIAAINTMLDSAQADQQRVEGCPLFCRFPTFHG